MKLRRIRARLERRLLGLTRRIALRHETPPKALGLQRIGSDYGGWIVPTALITDAWVAYCGGVGEDVTFDLGLIARTGCSVYAFDPTPRAITYVAEHAAAEPRFHFMAVGLWSEDTVLRFFAPRNPAHVSHSVVNLQRTDDFFEAPCRSIDSLMGELGHDRIDLLKLDIEGAEHRVVRSMLDRGIRPTVLCLEIDQPVRPWVLWRTVRRIRSAGYRLVAVDHWNLTFIRRDVVERVGADAARRIDSPTADLKGDRPRVTFGVIVLNGEPFTRHTLRAIYPFAHEIIVVEGAAPGARNIATADGHSRDGTLDALASFKADEDPEGKVTIVTAEDDGHADGFWPGEKDEQSRAYARRATGDYLWQVDIDEFYLPEDMERVLAMLAADPTIDAVTFRQITFWGGLDYLADGWYLRRGAADYHRLFKWRPGYAYAAHRPPTVVDETGRDLRTGHWLDGDDMTEHGIRLYHYSLLLPKQVIEKCDYYAHAEWARRTGALEWANEAYLSLRRPFRVHNVYAYPSWLERYRGPHPAEVRLMVDELRNTPGPIALRQTADIERLVDAPSYRVRRAVIRGLDPWDRRARRFERSGRRLGRRIRRVGRGGRRFGRRVVRSGLSLIGR